ncbi:MAG: DinB family protein [Terriglobia bacterium]
MKRILGLVEGKSPLAVQAATPRKLARLVRGISCRRLAKRSAPGKWSAAEILAHLSDTEVVGAYRIRMMLGTNGTPIQAIDQDRWARSGNYARRDPRRSLEEFRVLRRKNLELLRSLPRKKWNHYGRHQERGKETIARFVRLYAGHDLNHLRQIEGVLSP